MQRARSGEGAERGGELGGLVGVLQWSQFGKLVGQSFNIGVKGARGSG